MKCLLIYVNGCLGKNKSQSKFPNGCDETSRTRRSSFRRFHITFGVYSSLMFAQVWMNFNWDSMVIFQSFWYFQIDFYPSSQFRWYVVTHLPNFVSSTSPIVGQLSNGKIELHSWENNNRMHGSLDIAGPDIIRFHKQHHTDKHIDVQINIQYYY